MTFSHEKVFFDTVIGMAATIALALPVDLVKKKSGSSFIIAPVHATKFLLASQITPANASSLQTNITCCKGSSATKHLIAISREKDSIQPLASAALAMQMEYLCEMGLLGQLDRAWVDDLQAGQVSLITIANDRPTIVRCLELAQARLVTLQEEYLKRDDPQEEINQIFESILCLSAMDTTKNISGFVILAKAYSARTGIFSPSLGGDERRTWFKDVVELTLYYAASKQVTLN